MLPRVGFPFCWPPQVMPSSPLSYEESMRLFSLNEKIKDFYECNVDFETEIPKLTLQPKPNICRLYILKSYHLLNQDGLLEDYGIVKPKAKIWKPKIGVQIWLPIEEAAKKNKKLKEKQKQIQYNKITIFAEIKLNLLTCPECKSKKIKVTKAFMWATDRIYACENCGHRTSIHINLFAPPSDEIGRRARPNNAPFDGHHYVCAKHFYYKDPRDIQIGASTSHRTKGPAIANYRISDDYEFMLHYDTSKFFWHGLKLLENKRPLVMEDGTVLVDGKAVKTVPKNIVLETMLFNRKYGKYIKEHYGEKEHG